MRKTHYITVCLFFSIMFFVENSSQARAEISLQGTIYNSVTRKPIAFASVAIVEAREIQRTDMQGSYYVKIRKPGSYTVIIRSQGLRDLQTSITLTRDVTRNFYLNPLTLKGSGITVTDNRALQKISRRTMSRDDLKKTPASFGDAISALTSLPGIDRSGMDGLVGPLIIRGAYPSSNRYYVDGLLIFDPMHFGGLHSVINTNLMKNIDVYSSAMPSEFGGPTAAVIDIKTIDNVKEFGGYVDMGALSTAALLKTPIYRDVYDGTTIKKENAGYFIASGRYSTMENLLTMYKAYNKVRGNTTTIDQIPFYTDYQIKGAYSFDNRHSVRMLFFGGKDGWKTKGDQNMRDVSEGADPLLEDVETDYENSYHSLGLYYTYRLDRLKNEIMLHGSYKNTHNYLNNRKESAADWMKDYEQDIKPALYGIKDLFSLEWIKNHAELRGSLEYTYFHFTAKGDQYTRNDNTSGVINPSDEDLYVIIPLDTTVNNHVIGSYLENKFSLGGLTFTPGVHADYLDLTQKTTIDPRGLLSYEFPTRTTLSVAGGKYSSFVQVNPFVFSDNPNLAQYDYLKPERAYHSSAGIEQEIGQYTVELEGYYNYFYNQIQLYRHLENGEERYATNSGKMKSYGFEVMLRKEIKNGSNDFFGWISYTYNQSKEKTGITGNQYDEDWNDTGELFDPAGDKWVSSDYERKHSLKMVLGYTYNKHTISSKFQLYSSYAYTPIIGSTVDPDLSTRYIPIYDEENRNSETFPMSHRLDIRYSYKTNYEWGCISWYIELINVTRNKVGTEQDWRYNEPYAEGENPRTDPQPNALEGMIIPNFGVEVTF